MRDMGGVEISRVSNSVVMCVCKRAWGGSRWVECWSVFVSVR